MTAPPSSRCARTSVPRGVDVLPVSFPLSRIPTVKQIAEAPSCMPDVAAQPYLGGPLDWVGMEGIDAPVRIDAGDGDIQQVHARLDAFVNLVRTDRRGIHMSRLYLLIDEHLGAAALSPLGSQSGTSTCSSYASS